MKRVKHNRRRMTQIKQISTDRISEDQSDQLNQRSIPEHLPRLKAGWSWVKFGDVCDIVMGQSPPSSTYNTEEIGLPFFQGKAEFTELYPVVRKWCSEPNKIAEPLDILVSVRAPVGSSNIANQKCCIGRGLAALRYPDCNKYIFYYIRLIETELDELGTGSTFKAISSTTLRNVEIPLPPLPEQKKIVEKIEELFSGLDSGVASLKKAKEQIKLYRQSVLASAFNGKLIGNGKIDKKTGLPKNWKWVKLGDLIKVSSGKGLTSAKMLSDGEYSVYGGNGVSGYYNEFLFEEPRLIIGRVGAKCGVVHITKPKSWVTDNALIVDFISNNVEMKFLYHCLDYHNLNKLSVSTAQPVISGAKIYPYEIMLPPVTQQTQIVEEIEKRFSEADNLEKAIDDSLTKSETLRQSILKQAFEGRLV